MTSALQAAIGEAMAITSTDESAHQIKRAVSRALASKDDRIQIEDTNYFNHTIVPDLVLTWRDGDPSDERLVYLRATNNAVLLADDLSHLGRRHPILVPLDSVAAEPATESLDDLCVETDTLLTDPDAIDDLGSQASGDFARVLPSALLRGGRGVVGEAAVGALEQGVETAFAAARSHDPVALVNGTVALPRALTGRHLERLYTFLRVTWVASGGDPMLFPLGSDLGPLSDDALAFLLAEGPEADAQFWRTVGNGIDTARLVGLRFAAPPANLRALLAANLDRLQVRVAQVKAEQARLLDSPQSWSIDAGSVIFRGSDFTAYLGLTRDGIGVEADVTEGPRLTDLRARSTGLTLESVSLNDGTAVTVTIDSDTHADISADSKLDQYSGMPEIRVRRAGMLVSGKRLDFYFESRQAAGQTNALFSMREMVQKALAVLWPLGHEDLSELRSVVSENDSASEQLDLFTVLDRAPTDQLDDGAGLPEAGRT